MKSEEKVVKHIVNWLKYYSKKSDMQGFVVGVSGGIDSALTSTLCAKTDLKLLCLEMPIKQQPSQNSRASDHIEWLKKKFKNVSSLRIPLDKVFSSFTSILPETDNEDAQFHSLANTRARLRMTSLYYFAALNKYLVAGTGNKVEDFGVGFYTKYGDGGVDISPIADLNKTQVFSLAKYLNILDSIQKAAPTDGLWEDNRTDEDQIGASYVELEWAMNAQKKKLSKSSFNPRESEVYNIYLDFYKKNQHKMNPIPVCHIPDNFL